MRHNFSASRLTDYCQFYRVSNSIDEYGVPSQDDVFAFDCRADIKFKSGSQLADMGKDASVSVITILTYFNYEVASDMVVHYAGNRYQVEHINPDGIKQSMIVTCEMIGDIKFSDYESTGNVPDGNAGTGSGGSGGSGGQGSSVDFENLNPNNIPIVNEAADGFNDSPLSVVKNNLSSSLPIQAPDGGSVLIGDTLDIKTIGQQIGAQDLINGNQVIFPFRRVTDSGTSTALSAFGYDAAVWTNLQPSTDQTLTLNKGEQSVSSYQSTESSKVGGWRLQGIQGEMQLQLYGSFANGDERLIFDSLFHKDSNGHDISIDFSVSPLIEFTLPWSIGFRKDQITKIVVTGISDEPMQVLGVTLQVNATFGTDNQRSNGGFIPWFESYRAPETEDEFYPSDDNSVNSQNTWTSQKIEDRVGEIWGGINMADTDPILASHDKKVLMYNCTNGTVSQQVPVLGVDDNGWSVQITNTGNSQLQIKRGNQNRTISNGGSMLFVYCSLTDRFIMTAYRRAASEFDPVRKTFVNQQSVTLDAVNQFDIPRVFLVSEGEHIPDLTIKIHYLDSIEEYITVGAYEIDSDGYWSVNAKRNTFRGVSTGKYVVFDARDSRWVTGSFTDHNLLGLAGNEKFLLSGDGFIPESYGSHGVEFDFDDINELYLNECEPLIEFNSVDGSVTASFAGTHKTGLITI